MPLLSAILLLVVLMDPLGGLPCFIAVLRPVPPNRRGRVITRELFIALVIMLSFLICGRPVLGLLHLEKETLFISGGVVLFLIAINMIFPFARYPDEPATKEPFIVPLATPLIAGPSVVAMLLVLVSSQPNAIGKWVTAVCIAWGITTVILLCAPVISRILKEKGTCAVERLMGMLLLMVSVQMILNGLKHYPRLDS
ncbi:MAG TPA: MarC family protein [Candidatus Binatia bacterium]|nr:MarC family protein [Candidatus Binatia bacterium]